MNHKFSPALTDTIKCIRCDFDEKSHTDRATCEACGNSGNCEIFAGNMLLCSECIEKEQIAQRENEKGALERVSDARNEANRKIEESRKVDTSIRIRADIFNAKTVAIVELKKSIDENPEIENKHFALAKELDTRFQHLKDIIFGLRAEVTEHENEQRAIQTYYNELAKRLREEEREKIKLQDVNYKPIEPKTIRKPRAPKVKKFDKVEVRKLAKESGFPEQAIQILCMAKNLTPIQAVDLLKAHS
jgi:hypothetical protein